MSIMRMFVCPKCGTKAYHKLYNCLGNRLISKSYWKCMNCGARHYVKAATERTPRCAVSKERSA